MNLSYNVVNGIAYSTWLSSLLHVVDIDNWLSQVPKENVDLSKGQNADFDVRAQTLDLILYLYVRSSSILELHSALFANQHHNSYSTFDNQ